jgi:2,3,4,5-tetrahydropyridine-2-carboxylate N-succinyltransferase
MEQEINKLWQKLQNGKLCKDSLGKFSIINKVIENLDRGKITVAEKRNNEWQTNEWIKKAILLYFIASDNQLIEGNLCNYYDKIPLKFKEWDEEDFEDSGIRVVPGTHARKGCYIAKNSVLMPSFINIGAYIGEKTMIDTFATVGSCAYIGKNCHISGGVGIGGVLEPIQANPVIIEDNCFIGARSEVTEGVIVSEGSVIAMGVFLSASTKIINQQTGEVHKGCVPPYSVVVPGVINEDNYCSKAAAIIIKQVDKKTRSKTSINELLRE